MSTKFYNIDFTIFDDPEIKALVRKDKKQAAELERQRQRAKRFNSMKGVSPTLVGLILGVLTSRGHKSKVKDELEKFYKEPRPFKYKSFAQVLKDFKKNTV